MSYNESLRSNSNYPPMSQSQWDAAPFNEEVIPDREFDVICSQTLSKSMTVTTNNYQPEFDEEDGRTYANTEDTDWSEAFANSGGYTPLELIQLFGQILESFFKCGIVFKTPKYTQDLINECKGWQNDDTEIMEE